MLWLPSQAIYTSFVVTENFAITTQTIADTVKARSFSEVMAPVAGRKHSPRNRKSPLQ